MSNETTTPSQQDELSKDFPDEIVKQVQGMDYVPVAEVVSRLNRVLGVSNWSTTIVDVHRDQHNPEYVIAQVSISAVIDGKPCVADGVGGKLIAVRNHDNSIVDLGKDFKSAYSDALKKAAQRLGVGLHLARDEEAIHLDVEYDISEERWAKAFNAVKSMNPAQLEGLKAWWAKNGNSPKPTRETMTEDTFQEYAAIIKKLLAEEPALPAEDVADMLGGTVPDEAPPF